jgi:FkbM family methyltransferase
MRVLSSLALAPLKVLDLIEAAYLFVLGLISDKVVSSRVDRKAQLIENRQAGVVHQRNAQSIRLKFFTPNRVCAARAETFSTKEPQTLAWMDEFGGAGTLFDIGANVGLYSIYYAVTQPGRVLAFEPSVFNLKVLIKNINLNGVANKVELISNPLSDREGFAEFKLQSSEEGGSLSTFGVDFGHDGKTVRPVISYRTLGLSLDHMFESGLLSHHPRLVKIDVDGIEHLILEGARNTLANPECKSVLIEVNDSFAEMSASVSEFLSAAGFRLREKAELTEDHASPYATTFNQIWVKH